MGERLERTQKAFGVKQGQNKKEISMRNSNVTKNRIRVALLLVLAASIIGLAPAFSASARAGSFSINDVSGNYVELADGWSFGNGVVNFNPISQRGLVTS